MSYHRFAPSVLPFALLSVYGPVIAADSAAAPAQLDAVVVTATRTPQPLSKRLSDISVITQDDIARSGMTTISDLLKLQHGVEMWNSGGIESSSSISLRGANSGHTLLLIDGQRIGSSTLGQPNINSIPLAHIERIEILRGPASSLYGSDAIGGVIHIVTKKGEGPLKPNARIGAGRWDTYQAAAGFSGGARGFSYALQAEHAQSEGFNVRKPGAFGYNPDRDGYTRSGVSARAGFDLAPGHSLGVQAVYSDRTVEFDESGSTDDHDHQHTSALSIASENRFADFWQSRARLGQTIDQSTAHSFNAASFKTRQAQLSWLNDFQLGRIQTLTLGYERLEENVSSSSYDDNAPSSRDTDSAVAVYQLNYGPVSLQLNDRFDRNSQYGDKNTGAALLGLQIAPGWRASAGYSTAFKAPSFNDLYYPGYGRSAIQPETAKNAEIGLYFKEGDISASAVAYRNRIEDMIVYAPVCPDPAPEFVFGCAANVNKARLEGLSLNYAHTVDSLTLNLKGDWQNPTDEASGKLLVRRAKRHGLIALTQKMEAFRLGLELEGSSYRYNNAANSANQRMGGYALLHLNATYQWAPAWSVTARWNNVTDKEYELTRGYETPGTHLFVAVHYQP